MNKYKVTAPFWDKVEKKYIDVGQIEYAPERAQEINDNLKWYAAEKGVKDILILDKTKAPKKSEKETVEEEGE